MLHLQQLSKCVACRCSQLFCLHRFDAHQLLVPHRADGGRFADKGQLHPTTQVQLRKPRRLLRGQLDTQGGVLPSIVQVEEQRTSPGFLYGGASVRVSGGEELVADAPAVCAPERANLAGGEVLPLLQQGLQQGGKLPSARFFPVTQ